MVLYSAAQTYNRSSVKRMVFEVLFFRNRFRKRLLMLYSMFYFQKGKIALLQVCFKATKKPHPKRMRPN
ncbi:MAG: hypothetical protein CVU09_02455 [Bacteroidetes bacterium HGW-Bacteroidetes-4]|nr:MAG: hypothetical protein CVU09_02455 [Bacteroidetes bacterium HGW-Bacteroidetes-4]